MTAAPSLLVALLSWAPSSPATPPALPQDPPAPVRISGENVDREVAGLIAALVAQVEATPSDATAHAELGLAYEANTFFAAAADCYRNVLALTPDQKQWLYRLGVMQQALGEVDDALASMRAAAEAFKNTPVIQARLGDLLLVSGRPDEAAAAWERAIAAEVKQPQQIAWAPSRVGLAQARYDQGRIEEAVALLREALQLVPDYRHAHYLLGTCLLDLGEEEEGRLELARGVNAWPQYPPDPHQPKLDSYAVGYNRRMMGIENLLQSGRPADAESVLREVLGERPEDHLALNLLAKTLTALGRPDEALEALRRSEAADPEAYATKIDLTIALLNRIPAVQGRVQAIEAQAQEAGASATEEQRAELTKQHEEAAAELQSLTREALEKAQAAALIAPNLGRARYFNGLAQFSLAGGDPQRIQGALGEFEWALTLGCQEPELFRYMGMAYAQTGRLKEMVAFAETLAGKHPEDPSAHVFVAQAYLTKDQMEPDRALRDGALAQVAKARELSGNEAMFVQMEQQFRQEVERRNAAAEQKEQAGAKPQVEPPLPPPDEGGGGAPGAGSGPKRKKQGGGGQ